MTKKIPEGTIVWHDHSVACSNVKWFEEGKVYNIIDMDKNINVEGYLEVEYECEGKTMNADRVDSYY